MIIYRLKCDKSLEGVGEFEYFISPEDAKDAGLAHAKQNYGSNFIPTKGWDEIEASIYQNEGDRIYWLMLISDRTKHFHVETIARYWVLPIKVKGGDNI